MTNFEKIKAMGVEELAEYIDKHDDALCDKICNAVWKQHHICPDGIDDESVERYCCIRCIKNWLESEAEKDG